MSSSVLIESASTVVADFGEGPIWDETAGILWWVDIPLGEVHGTNPETGETQSFQLTPPVSAVWPTSNGGLAAAEGLAVVTLDREGNRTGTFAQIPGAQSMRLNDGVCARDGSLVVGSMTMRPQEPRAGTVWRVGGNDAPRAMIENVALANGCDWSPDGELFYFVDTLTRRIDVFDVSGEDVTNRRTLIELGHTAGVPDGLCVDADGCVWVALAGGGMVRRYTPAGELSQEIMLPVSHPTSCAFGGPGMNQLFVTTARQPLTDAERIEQPLAGCLLRIDLGITGLAGTPLRLA